MTPKHIALTGHTEGIGKALYTHLRDQGHQVTGMSRRNGFDLAKDIELILEKSAEADVFINNAFFEFQNVSILYRLFMKWQNLDKLIVNIGSDSGDGNKDYIHPYAVAKSALDKACDQLQNVDGLCRVVNIRPGYVDTPKNAEVTLPKLNIADVVRTVDWCLQQPESVYLRSISLKARSQKL